MGVRKERTGSRGRETFPVLISTPGRIYGEKTRVESIMQSWVRVRPNASTIFGEYLHLLFSLASISAHIKKYTADFEEKAER
jgi:hypothetical protein